MFAMDGRKLKTKQKRIGPAPIASFEKSFDDMSSSYAGLGTTITPNEIYEIQQRLNDNDGTTENMHNRNGLITDLTNQMMDESTISTGTPTTISINNTNDSIKKRNQADIANVESDKTTSPNYTISTSTSTIIKTTNLDQDKEKTNESLGSLPSSFHNTNTHLKQKFKQTNTLCAPLTPRIELSRASSSSHHEEDSRSNSPEKLFEQGDNNILQEPFEMGFQEEGALELRSSTEELFFLDPQHQKEEEIKMQQQQQQPQQEKPIKRVSPLMFKFTYDNQQQFLQQHQRKDSANSEVSALLCISGRTSRVSSVGSQGSAVSHLSTISGISRSPSPHRMQLETSFCGPKSSSNIIEKGVISSHLENQITLFESGSEDTTLLEQVLLARTKDPTQVILAEGISVTIKESPKRKPLPICLKNNNADDSSSNKIKTKCLVKENNDVQKNYVKNPGQMIIGKTPSGTEYIRINLKPHHMYKDKGVALHEEIVEAPDTLAPVYPCKEKKPISLNVTPKKITNEDSRSPSPAAVTVSRKSSFSSLFRFGLKETAPDTPREIFRGRSKSKDRPITQSQSQNATPIKQKTVLNIFKTGGNSKRGSSAGNELRTSKTALPINSHEMQPLNTSNSRPGSRLRYYDEPVDGFVHIPLHSPPEQQELQKLFENIQQLNETENTYKSLPPAPLHNTGSHYSHPLPGASITLSELTAAAAALKPVGIRKEPSSKAIPFNQEKRSEAEVEVELKPNDIIRKLSKDGEMSRNSENNKNNSLNFEHITGSIDSYAKAIRNETNRLNIQLHQTKDEDEIIFIKNERLISDAEKRIPRLSSEESAGSITSMSEVRLIKTKATINTSVMMNATPEERQSTGRERRKLLFATRIGSNSEDDMFCTQFSISKTESISSHMSEQTQETSEVVSGIENLHRQDTVIRKQDEKIIITKSKSNELLETQESKNESEMDQCNQNFRSKLDDFIIRHQNRQASSDCRQYYPSYSTSEDDPEIGRIECTEKALHKHSKKSPLFNDKDILTNPCFSKSIISPGNKKKTATKMTPESSVEHDYQIPYKPPRVSPPIRRTSTSSISVINTNLFSSPISTEQTLPTSKLLRSSGSEHDSDSINHKSSIMSEVSRDVMPTSTLSTEIRKRHMSLNVGYSKDHESAGLVSQESFEDDLPYVPTTLPEERAQGISLIPMKERVHMELKTCPLDRPRSTTPLNPTHLDEYFGMVMSVGNSADVAKQTTVLTEVDQTLIRGEKLRINLPRKDSKKEGTSSGKSSRKYVNSNGKSWFQFAEAGLRGIGTVEHRDIQQLTKEEKSISQSGVKQTQPPKTTSTNRKTNTTPVSTQRKLSGHWIDFENIPEKRKLPKRITTLPRDSINRYVSRDNEFTFDRTENKILGSHLSTSPVAINSAELMEYNYVKPEDCQCECHEAAREMSGTSGTKKDVYVLKQGEDMLPLIEPEVQEIIQQRDTSHEFGGYANEQQFPIRMLTKSRSKTNFSKKCTK